MTREFAAPYLSAPFPPPGMNVHEYQAKELFVKFGVPTSPGRVARTPEDAETAAKELSSDQVMVKAQLHAGGRFKGGVHLAKTPAEARDLASKMLGETLVTHQTGPAGKQVSQVLVAQAVDIAKEYYLAILMDRATGAPMVIASTEGGVNIEEVAEKHPDKIIRVPVHPLLGLQQHQARSIAAALGFRGGPFRQATDLLLALYRLFVGCDCSMVEINPRGATRVGRGLALDAKLNFDDYALFRHKDVVAMRDESEEDPREVEASKHGLNYIGLDGSIACLVNGAGLAMATMDIIQYAGGKPANFLDVGGGASKEQVSAAFKIILADPHVKGILVNIFGGIMDCNVIATGIVAAARETGLSIPLVVRLEGNNVEAGKRTLAESGLALTSADDLKDAAHKVVAAVGKAA